MILSDLCKMSLQYLFNIIFYHPCRDPEPQSPLLQDRDCLEALHCIATQISAHAQEG